MKIWIDKVRRHVFTAMACVEVQALEDLQPVSPSQMKEICFLGKRCE